MLLASAPQLLNSPCCDVINRVPWGFFMVVHVALFALGVVFALRMFQDDRQLFGWGFSLFALAELSYMTYHVNVTLFLFAHTISEVLVGGGLVTIFAALVKSGVVDLNGRQTATRSGGSREAVPR
jgi:Na+/melibiose symporter-like transporter